MGRKPTSPPEPAPDHLRAIVERFAGRRVLVVGDVILDRYLWGDVERTSFEAPVPVVNLRAETDRPGGAANVVANLAALGARPQLVGVVGADGEGRAVRDLLRAMRVSPQGLVVDRARPTIVKTRVIAQRQQLMRLDREETAPISPAVARALVARARKALAGAAVMVLSDYAKGTLGPDVCRELIAAAHNAGALVVVDPKGTDFSKYRGADIVKPNRREAEAASGRPIDSPAALDAAAAALRRAVRGRALVITLDGGGAAIFESGRPTVRTAAQALAVFDVTGAGDSFIAAMSAALAAGAGIADAARLGNLAGSIAVGKLGAATVEPAELLRALDPGAGHRKLRSCAQLLADLAPHRALGRRIVFTNGCFDLIHLGHLKFLEQARRLGDLLVVAINSDASVRAVKGAPRPVLGQNERAAILGALEAVDFVVIFDERTPERLLEQIRPDILVKGKALRAGQIVGADLVPAWGGRVVSLPLLGEMTTDRLLERIARQSRP
ncbi:MAG TPA: D-glycero-beta-D-manno-heptose-7-phosphate kinase [Candidatus Sumerlaeota bacterium]|nr:D-glycero-beta-D-manno-heptose-7-phosphate kinase [Candidatus Sumerlaeota bacterium]